MSAFRQNKTIIDHILKRNQTYSQVNCLDLCFDLFYLENNACGCVNTTLGSVWFDCWIRKEQSNLSGCTYLHKSYFYKNKLTTFYSKFCPLECESVSYSITINDYENDYESNLTALRVYFRSLKHTLIKQYPKLLIFDLISNIGGTLGLFIGVSFVSLFEITEIVAAITSILIRKPNRKQEQKSRDESNTNVISLLTSQMNELSTKMIETEKQIQDIQEQLSTTNSEKHLVEIKIESN